MWQILSIQQYSVKKTKTTTQARIYVEIQTNTWLKEHLGKRVQIPQFYMYKIG